MASHGAAAFIFFISKNGQGQRFKIVDIFWQITNKTSQFVLIVVNVVVLTNHDKGQLLLPEEPGQLGRSRSGSNASQADEWVWSIWSLTFINIINHLKVQSISQPREKNQSISENWPSSTSSITSKVVLIMVMIFPASSWSDLSKSCSTIAKCKRPTQKQTPEFFWG